MRRLIFNDTAPGQPFYAYERQPDFAFPLHCHDFWEAFLCIAGRGVHECNGQIYQLRPGDLWLLRPDDVHSVRPQCDFAFINVAWPTQNWDKWCQIAEFSLALTAPNVSAPNVSASNVSAPNVSASNVSAPNVAPQHVAAPELEALFHRVARSFAMDLASPLEICHFWSKLAGVFTPPRPAETRPDWMLRGLRALEGEGGLRAGFPHLLQAAHVSPGHLCREWKKVFGVTPTHWINARRLENAAQLLLQSNLPIKAISARCGFENTTYFYRLFQQKYGIPPGIYRQKTR